MTTIFTRSALVYHGHNPAPDVATVVIDPLRRRRVITWSDVMRERRERQSRRLEYKRSFQQLRVFKLWVAYFDQRLMGGWQAFLQNLNEQIWIDRDRSWLKDALMRLFPYCLPGIEDWHTWKVAFATSQRRGTRCRRPRGVAFVWWDGHGETFRRAT